MSYSTPPPIPPHAPIPVVPLAYSHPPRRGRPAIITAMGVMSIVVACLSGLVNLWGAFTSAGSLMISRIPAAAFAPPPPPAVATADSSMGTASIGGMAVDPAQSTDGIADTLRPRIILGMSRAQPLDQPRTKQLDLLLAVAGQSMFPFVSPATTPQTIRANVSESGRLPSASGAGDGPDYFIIGTGRVEVYDDHAIFRPLGSPDVVSVAAPRDDPSAGVPPASTAAPPATQPGTSVTSMSVVTTGPGGTTTVTTTTTAGAVTVGNPFGRISPIAAGLSLLEYLLSLALAIYLLVIGILVLRDSPRGRKLHWIYVGVKIPLVVFAVAVNIWLWSGLASSMTAAMPAGPGAAPPPTNTSAITGMLATSALVGGAVALAYPVALIFVLRSRTVRAYYGPVRQD